MNTIGRHEPRGFAGKALLLLGIWGAAALFMALFWVKNSDLLAAREEALREKLPPSEETAALMPEITRRDFEFKLPVPGQRGKYHWKVNGRRSVSVTPTTDKIFDFKGEMVDRDEVTTLSSPVALFDKEERILSSQDGVVLQTEWARVEAPKMLVQMKSDNTEFSGGVMTRIDTAKAPVNEFAPNASATNGIVTEGTNAEKPKKKKKKRSPLVITSKKLSLDMKKNTAIYTGDVAAKDDSGRIYADKMKAENYTDEEKKKNPKLKGVKTVTCTGNVVIDQTEGKKQARCTKAVYDAASNIIRLYGDPKTGRKVVYRDEVAMRQIKALELIFDRNENKVTFDKEVETIEYNPDRKSFLGFMGPERSKPETSKAASGSDEKARGSSPK